MNDNRDEIQRLRAMRAEAINRGDFGRADAIGADLARLESAAGGTIDWIGYTKLDSFVRAGRVRRSPWRTQSTPGISPTSSSGR